jgi:NADH-quinone oxidoreductase subunit L
MIQYVWAIPAVMLLAALINGLGVRKLGKAAGFISVGAMALTFVMSCAIFLETKHNLHEAEEAAAAITPVDLRLAKINEILHEKGSVKLWTWLDIPAADSVLGRDLNVDLAFYVDPLSATFLMFISFIGTLVFLYAVGYMKEKHTTHGHGHDDHHATHANDTAHDAEDEIDTVNEAEIDGVTEGDHHAAAPAAAASVAHAHDDHHHDEPHGTPDADGWVLDPGYARFFSYVALFAAMMFTLVLGDNLLVMFIGWEGVGLCSYLLIGYFFDKPFSESLSCADAGRKAFVMNRIGDFGLMLGMFLFFWGLGTINIQDIISILSSRTLMDGTAVPAMFQYGGAAITAAALLLFLGATGKSAQIPLFTWLPDAMAGPTPVSALIHAATMVTAGVYMVARLNVVYMLAPTAMATVAIIGALTAFVAAFAGLTQRGIKKALAYSTVSQLGYMFLAMGVGAFAGGIFHVFTHAFFKACLFLGAGSVIHSLHHEEDMYKMGGLRKKMPITAWTYLIATFCIAGVPFTSGFFSKDEILYMSFLSAGDQVPYLFIIGMITAAMTALYMGRTYFLTFEGESRVDPHVEPHVHESPKTMTTALVALAALALGVGFLNVPHGLIPMGGANAMFHHFLEPVTDRGAAVVASQMLRYSGEGIPYGPQVITGNLGEVSHSLELILAAVSGIMAIIVLLIAKSLYTNGVEKEKSIARSLGPVYAVSEARWWWDDFYNALFKDGTMIFAKGVWKFDLGIIDGIVNGIGRTARGFGMEFRRLQNGQVQVYALIMVVGVVSFLVYFALGLMHVIN